MAHVTDGLSSSENEDRMALVKRSILPVKREGCFPFSSIFHVFPSCFRSIQCAFRWIGTLGLDQRDICGRCIDLQDRLEEGHPRENHDQLQILQERYDQLDETTERQLVSLQSKYDSLYEHYIALQKHSDYLTSKMAEVSANSGDLECLNDPFANTKLANEFDNNIRNNLWIDLCENIVDEKGDHSEVEVLRKLSNMMQSIHGMCYDKADNHIREFLFLDPGDDLPFLKNNLGVYSTRKNIAHNETVTNKIKLEIRSSLQQTEDYQELVRDTSCEATTSLQEFVEKFALYCWLMTVATPRMVLRFDAVGRPYDDIKDRYVEYATQDEVEDEVQPVGTVKCVAWPSVELQDFANIWKKGEVVVTKS
ncbi:uncharacterized protein LOC128216910 [Mya arenaria]|uniref:uncharacterized protein LOC128216910 n=1 Tax=Mya arenaria TaxID=6604 RepID=UPI0022DFC4F2|nr:uncharacterized protein LOC128216910 [Mya arenaria]XP_052779575.1 uncharacterized protein LOC128216910 [Mya arenaria]